MSQQIRDRTRLPFGTFRTAVLKTGKGTPHLSNQNENCLARLLLLNVASIIVSSLSPECHHLLLDPFRRFIHANVVDWDDTSANVRLDGSIPSTWAQHRRLSTWHLRLRPLRRSPWCFRTHEWVQKTRKGDFAGWNDWDVKSWSHGESLW